MDLSGLLPSLIRLPAFADVAARIASGESAASPLANAARAAVVAGLRAQLGRPILVVVARPEAARRLEDDLAAYGDDAARLFPETGVLPYEPRSPDAETERQRLRVLADLIAGDADPIIVAPLAALLAKTTPPTAPLTLRQGDTLRPAEFLARCLDLGYEVTPQVVAPGEVGRRGGIIDVFPPQADAPFRIELLGDTIESLRRYDPLTQRSQERLTAVAVGPARETPDDSAAPSASLLDYLPAEAIVVLDDPDAIEGAAIDFAARADDLRQEAMSSAESLPEPAYFTWAELGPRLRSWPHRLDLLPWSEAERGLAAAFGPAPSFGGRLRPLVAAMQQWAEQGRRVVVVSLQAQRLAELLRDDGWPATATAAVGEVAPGVIAVVEGALTAGWVLHAEPELILLSDAEVFGFVKQRRAARAERHPRTQPLRIEELAVGDYAVHVDHGIGRFAGTVHLSLDGVEREYLALEYAEGDKLYVPLDQIDRVSRYVGPGEFAPPLSRLAGAEWARTKERVRRSVGETARELLALYASREVIAGFAFAPDTPWQAELEASFPYVETDDQLAAIGAVKADMESPQPMDRLICGDVGYGKTEVAIRAAFKAVQDGAQVAVLVPTTVLAQQHLQTFGERLAAFPVRVEMLSRFRSDAEQRQIISDLKSGAIDICIGTHRLVQRDVGFRNLGLVIIDEEHRFGVAHKERLKQMRQEVDVLTLSATPIPRTLYMALSGVRDVSTMATPPFERMPIATAVAAFDERPVRNAILRELERGGQVFFVHNRVQSIGMVTARLELLVPEASFVIGHGQMPEDELERVMLDFAAGRHDVLVCTTIIEAGLDLPNVNTIIINQADRLGLAQLYQLRGRVGRGAQRAFAHLLYDQGKRLTDAARRRLRAIFEATELGAGFRIAMSDLEIRGAGNLLGAQQSGHIAAVGLDLYTRLLAEAVAERRGEAKPTPIFPTERAGPSIDLPLSAYLPDDYVPDVPTRLALYHRVAAMSEPAQVDDLEAELTDRFGPPPLPAQNMLYLLRLRALGQRAGVDVIVVADGAIVVRLKSGLEIPNRRALERARIAGLRLGRTQLRLAMAEGWQRALRRALAIMAEETK